MMSNFNMEGIGRIKGGSYDNIHIEGVSSCSDSIKAEKIHIEGVFNCSGDIEAEFMHCEGVSDFKSNIRTKKITISGVFNMKQGTKLEAEEVICDGVIKTNGEIYTDILKADGCVNAKEIYGDQISITTHYSVHKIKRFFNNFSNAKSEIALIEATTINLSGVMVDTVNGRDITIGPNCRIKHIDCSGTLAIDRSSTVGEITGNYVRRDYP